MLLVRAIVLICFYELRSVLSKEYEMQVSSWKPVEEISIVSNTHVSISGDPSEENSVLNSDLDQMNYESPRESLEFSNTQIPMPEALRHFFRLYDSKIKRELGVNSADISIEFSNQESKDGENVEKIPSDYDVNDDDIISEDRTAGSEIFPTDSVSNDELYKELQTDAGDSSKVNSSFGSQPIQPAFSEPGAGVSSKVNSSFGDQPIQPAFYETEPRVLEDLTVSYGTPCDRVINESCWIEQTVGETLTLGLDIPNYRFDSPIEIQWTKMYHQLSKKQDLEIQIEPDRLPWNMVMGSGGLELRLNPVTDGDLDPNALVAKVYMNITNNNKNSRKKLIKRLEFRIEVSAIEFKRVYPGEELNINIEEYLSLPENGDLTLQWRLEKPNGQVLPVPSNFKVSWSGRLVVVKEMIRKDHLGVLTCTVYSSNKIAVAKRRFLLKRSDPRKSGRLRKRSTRQYRRRALRGGCLPDARAERMIEYYRIKSRKKRLKSGPSKLIRRGCRNAPFRRRLHPRWIPFHFVEDDAALDSRLVPIEKLIDLSERGDGTLDDEIPHETHFVNPMATVVSDDFAAPSAQANCSKDTDCGTGAVCVRPKWRRAPLENAEGFCYCKPEYFGDGFECTKIPRITREKRIRRSAKTTSEAPSIPPLHFKILEKFIRETHSDKISPIEKKSMKDKKYEEEDAYLLTTCTNSHDCGQHATCEQNKEKHPFCKCNPGYRGNGIFCWEIMDYFPISRSSDNLKIK